MKASEKSRRQFLKISGLSMAGLALPVSFHAIAQKNDKDFLVYIGTYTNEGSKGIYIYKLDILTGAFQHVNTVSGVDNPSFLAFDPQKKFLFSVNEVTDFQGKKSGAVSAFSVHNKTGELTFLNQQPTSGGAPCYVHVDQTGKSLMVANYVGGNVAIYPIRSDGHIGPSAKVIDHNDAGEGKDDQAHAHCIVTGPDNKFVFAADLGMDKIYIYKLDAEKATLTPHEPHFVATKEGAGPRHFTFHTNGKFAYVINELNSTLTTFNYNQSNGTLTEIQTLSTLPADYKGENFCADIHVSPNGRFLYGSNRGHNSIVVYSVDQKSGKLTLTEHVSTLGNWPRNFNIDPSGKILLVANQKSNDLFSFFINSKNGKLTPTGEKLELSAPVFVKMVPMFN